MLHFKIDTHFIESGKLVRESLPKLKPVIFKSAGLIDKTFKLGGKLLICGNGGSAAQAQHFAAELTGRYLKERQALPAISLTTDTSALTAIGNDYGFDKVFSRQVQALGRAGDVLFCLSTSGNSPNILAVARTAQTLGIKIIGLTGNSGGKLKSLCDINLIVPSHKTPFVQEVHLVVIHVICDLIESSL